MLPPKPAPKQTVAVNVRFNILEYERLQRLANYREMSVTTLVHLVVGNYLLPRMERQMRQELAQASSESPRSASPDWIPPESDEDTDLG